MKYKDKNLDQKINSCAFLKSLKDVLRAKSNNICKYSRQFKAIFSKLIRLN